MERQMTDYQRLEAENERLMIALTQIAYYPQGQIYSAGFAPGDAERMQDIALAAVKARHQATAA